MARAALRRTPEITLAIKERVFKNCFLMGMPVSECARRFDLTVERIGQILKEGKANFDAEAALDFNNPIAAIKKKVAQLDVVIDEAFRAWQKSKRDAQSVVAQEELVPIFEEQVDKKTGKTVRVLKERKLEVVKRITRIAGRLPLNEYLTTITNAVREQARLEGLVSDAVVTLIQNNYTQNNNSDQKGICWEQLSGKDERTDRSDSIEQRIADAALPPVAVPQIQSDWTPAEIVELEDENNDESSQQEE